MQKDQLRLKEIYFYDNPEKGKQIYLYLKKKKRVGGNLRAIGVKPDGSQWTGGVENPWSSSDVYTSDSMLDGAINMSDMALVTSGDYQRYYVVDGKRYHHLIDPDTPVPRRLL